MPGTNVSSLILFPPLTLLKGSCKFCLISPQQAHTVCQRMEKQKTLSVLGAMTEKTDHAQVGNSLPWCQKKAKGRTICSQNRRKSSKIN